MIFIPPGLPPALAEYLGEDDDELTRKRVQWRVRRFGSLTRVLGADSLEDARNWINRIFDAAESAQPEKSEWHDGFREALLRQVEAEFRFGLQNVTKRVVWPIEIGRLRFDDVRPKKWRPRARWGGRAGRQLDGNRLRGLLDE